MSVITVRRTVIKQVPRGTSIKRMVIKGTPKKAPTTRRSFRELARRYFASENRLELAIEALFFAIIVAISAWPILTAAGALQEFFQRALT
jgi:hypothetical protein